VRLVGPSSIDEMVLAFVRAEADGPRYRDNYVGLDRRLIDEPDLRTRRRTVHAGPLRMRIDAVSTTACQPTPAGSGVGRATSLTFARGVNPGE
jgi:hypothetical protein